MIRACFLSGSKTIESPPKMISPSRCGSKPGTVVIDPDAITYRIPDQLSESQTDVIVDSYGVQEGGTRIEIA